MYGQLRKLSAAAPPLVDMSGGKGIFAALLRGPVAAARGARGAERGGKPQPQHSPAVRLLAECRLLLGGDADADQEAAAAAAPRQPAGLASSQQHSVLLAGVAVCAYMYHSVRWLLCCCAGSSSMQPSASAGTSSQPVVASSSSY
jgi:hypothetical protein